LKKLLSARGGASFKGEKKIPRELGAPPRKSFFGAQGANGFEGWGWGPPPPTTFAIFWRERSHRPEGSGIGAELLGAVGLSRRSGHRGWCPPADGAREGIEPDVGLIDRDRGRDRGLGMVGVFGVFFSVLRVGLPALRVVTWRPLLVGLTIQLVEEGFQAPGRSLTSTSAFCSRTRSPGVAWKSWADRGWHQPPPVAQCRPQLLVNQGSGRSGDPH